MEHGRIAIEALTAVEVQALVADQLSALEVSELPQQMILKTTNPILMAYKYVSPPYRLALEVTRHQVVAVQEAAQEVQAQLIDLAAQHFEGETSDLVSRGGSIGRASRKFFQLAPAPALWQRSAP